MAGGILLALAGLFLLMGHPRIQTALASKALQKLTAGMDADIRFDGVQVTGWNTVTLNGLVILDRTPFEVPGEERIDTFARIDALAARFSAKSAFSGKGIHLDRAQVRGGCFNLVLEPDGTNLTRIFRIQKKEEKKTPGDIFDISHVNVENFRFRMLNYKRGAPQRKPAGINWADLDVRNICAQGRKMKFSGGVMSAVADRVSFEEKSGYKAYKVSGRTKVGDGKTLIDDLEIHDRWSDIDARSFKMLYDDGPADLSAFIDSVGLYGDFRPSHVDFRSLAYFAPALSRFPMDFDITGVVDGPVADLGVMQLDFFERGSRVAGTLDGHLTGLPSWKTMLLSYDIRALHFTTGGLDRFIRGWAPRAHTGLGRYAKEEKLHFRGRVHGPLNRMDVQGRLHAALGAATARIRLSHLIDPGTPLRIGGTLQTEDLDIGRAIGSDAVRQCSLDTGMEATFGDKGMKVRIDSLRVSRLNLFRYDYSRIAAAGTYEGKAFNGRIVCHDPNLNFLFQGLFSLSDRTRNARYQFYMNVGYADLYALHLDPRGTSKVRFVTQANFNRLHRGDLIGNIDISDLCLENDSGRHDIGNVQVSSHNNDHVSRMKLVSRFAEASYVGSEPVTTFVRDLVGVTAGRELSALLKNPVSDWNGNRYSIQLKTLELDELMQFVAPGMRVSPGSTVQAGINPDGTLHASVRAKRIVSGTKQLRGLEADFSNAGRQLGGEIRCASALAGGLTFKNNLVHLLARDNHVGIEFAYDNESELANKGEFYLTGDLSRRESGLAVDARIQPSFLYVNDKAWLIRPASLSWKDRRLHVKGFRMDSEDQALLVSGGLSPEKKDTLSVDLEHFDLAFLNTFIGDKLGIEGLATGSATLISPLGKETNLLVNMVSEATRICGEPAGSVQILSDWNEARRCFDLLAENRLDGMQNLRAEGSFSPSDGVLDVHAQLQRLNLGYLKGVLSFLFHETAGAISGQVHAKGPLKQLEVRSEGLRLDDGILGLDFTKVRYGVSGPLRADSKGLWFDGLTLTDAKKHKGSIQGGILYDHFRDVRMDTRIHVDGVQCLNTTEKDNPSFYGNVSASGDVAITGPLNAILLDINAATTGAGDFHIPLSGGGADGRRDLLRFKEAETPVLPADEEMDIRPVPVKKAGGLAVKLRIQVHPGIEGLLELDKSSGNVLNGIGSGLIELDVQPGSGGFNLYGDYNLLSGNFLFTTPIAKREFNIQNGSSVRFKGDLMETDLNVNALYKTKASPATLLADTTSVTNIRVVECGIHATGKLKNPAVRLSIDIPDLDPTVKSRVEAALNTDDKIQKQFLSLLVTGNFLPDEQSGIVNTSSMVYSNVMGLMTNQFNSIMQRLDIPIDLGLNYQPTDSGNDLFDVAVSTQLFNNRVLVNGNIGNRQYSTGGNQSEMAGDLDIEIKLDRPGALRLNLFSHSADAYTNYLDNSQRNGLGLAYQKEYSSLGKMLRRIFMKKSRREAEKRREEAEQLDEERRVIHINAEDKDKKK